MNPQTAYRSGPDQIHFVDHDDTATYCGRFVGTYWTVSTTIDVLDPDVNLCGDCATSTNGKNVIDDKILAAEATR